jgi:hypothetical protein
MGIDVEPGCKHGPLCFSVALVENGKLVNKHEKVPLHRLIRLVWEYRPRILAVDNILELARNKRELARILSLLPSDTMIVQTTRLPDGRFVELRKLAHLAGLSPSSGKLSPSRTAYLVALLAEMGYGTPIRYVEEKTKIIVAKSRKLKHGGMSARRYQRRVRAAILRAAKDIKKALDRSGLDYDLMFRKSGGGLDSAVFIVYAPRDRVSKVVKPHEDTDIRIEIESVYRSEIEFVDTIEYYDNTRSKPFIIVGVDPGVSTGIAAVDLNGEPVFAVSRRGLDRSEVIAIIRQYGIPVLIATDVTPAPDFVRKLAASLRVPVYEPPASLSVEEKRMILDEYTSKYPDLRRIADSHVRDALAAAVKALHVYGGKMRQIESYVNRIGLDIDAEKVKADVIRGATIAEAVENAINELLAEDYTPPDIHDEKSKHNTDGASQQNTQLLTEIELLRAENRILKKKLAELEDTVKALEIDLKIMTMSLKEEVERDREITMLRERILSLQGELERLRSRLRDTEEDVEKLASFVFGIARGHIVPAIVIHDLSSETLEIIEEKSRHYGRQIVIIESPNPIGLERHADKLARTVLALLVPSRHYEKLYRIAETLHIPLLVMEEYVVERIGSLAFLDGRVVIDAYSVLEEYKKRSQETSTQKELSINELRKLIEEYRMRRARLLLKNNGEVV